MTADPQDKDLPPQSAVVTRLGEAIQDGRLQDALDAIRELQRLCTPPAPDVALEPGEIGKLNDLDRLTIDAVGRRIEQAVPPWTETASAAIDAGDLDRALAALPDPEDDPLAAVRAAVEKGDAPAVRQALQDAMPLEESEIPVDPPDPPWLVPDWLPADRVAFLSGRGAVGKSRLALQLAAAVADDDERAVWLPSNPPGHAVRVGRTGHVVIVTWEDAPAGIGWRLRRIFSHHDIHHDEPRVRRRLHLLDLAKHGPAWGALSPLAPPALTPAGHKIRDFAEAVDARLLIIDPLAAAFGANENDRSQVRTWMANMDAWARANDCAVLLISHPAKATSGEGAAYSGSTDWRNAARAAWLLGHAASGDETAPRLTCDKSSYGPPPRPLTLDADGTIWRTVPTAAKKVTAEDV